MSSGEAYQFVELTTSWKQGHKFLLENCIVYNFGFEKEIPLTQISMDLSSDFKVSLKTKGIEAPNLCSLVFVAGRYVERLNEVVKIVDGVTKATDNVPKAVYLFRNLDDKTIFDAHERY